MGNDLKRKGGTRRNIPDDARLASAQQGLDATVQMVKKTVDDNRQAIDATAFLSVKASTSAVAAERFGAKTSSNPITDLQRRISELKESLTNEINQLKAKKSIWSFFTNFEIVTKQKKITALLRLEGVAQNKSELANLASEMIKNSRVMRSMKTSRTKDLVNAIIAATKDVTTAHQNDEDQPNGYSA